MGQSLLHEIPRSHWDTPHSVWRETSMPQPGFEPAFTVKKRPQTHAFDSVATRTRVLMTLTIEVLCWKKSFFEVQKAIVCPAKKMGKISFLFRSLFWISKQVRDYGGSKFRYHMTYSRGNQPVWISPALSDVKRPDFFSTEAWHASTRNVSSPYLHTN